MIPAVANQKQFQIFFETYRTQPITNKKVIIPLPERDFDLTQTAVLWKILKANGIKVEFASEAGEKAVVNPDHLRKPDIINVSMFYPAFEPRRYFMEMEKDSSFLQPIPYAEIKAEEYTGMVLIAGNTLTVKHYLECKLLQSKVQDFWSLKRPVGAIGQAVLIMVRTVDNNKQPLIHFKRTTSYPKLIEFVGKLNPFSSSSVYIETTEDEVIRNLNGPHFFSTSRDVFWDNLFELAGFIVKDDWYLSARWEGDSYTFSAAFAKMVLDCPFENHPDPEKII
jgi:putative intracellular protease/amidase